MKKLTKWLLIGIPLAIIAGLGIVSSSLFEKYRGFSGETFVTIHHGMGSRAIANALAEAGVIRSPWQLMAARVLHPSAKLQAGEYRFSQPATVNQVVERLAHGDVYFFEFTIPEGSNIFDIAQAVEGAHIMPGADFLRAAQNPASIRDLDAHARSLEGYLFPSTYRLKHTTTAVDLCHLMTAEFRRQWKKLAADREADIHRTVTLASLVEKETSVSSERPVVAGVYLNRLEKRMRLGCDPTTIYAAILDHRYTGVIHKSDLASENPYNTYQHEGLPPGPIANPGAKSLEAALNPAKTDYLFFVAKPSGGGHVFTTTYADHKNAVGDYRATTRHGKTQ